MVRWAALQVESDVVSERPLWLEPYTDTAEHVQEAALRPSDRSTKLRLLAAEAQALFF